MVGREGLEGKMHQGKGTLSRVNALRRASFSPIVRLDRNKRPKERVEEYPTEQEAGEALEAIAWMMHQRGYMDP
jgi:hypothetical protein